ncbi:putative inorganic carbon transporter subunit DabA, partial [Halorubrum pallidum]
DWAETRPEWGLAGNAGFVVGPRELTRDRDLDGRAFLHSYDWSTDPDGDALEAILTGPMVVTQWINAQYYFSTTDNAVYGSGSKVTQNPVGNVGVYQGNGGDLMSGLPLQSLMAADDEPYHQPLRLSTVVHAPVERVTDVLADHEELTELLDNDWTALTVVDPTRDHRAFHYEEHLEWVSASERTGVPHGDVDAPAVAND